MKIKRGKLITITAYVVSIIIYIIIGIFIYNMLSKIHYYYLFATIPLLFLLFFLVVFHFIKILLLSASLVFEHNDNDEIEEIIEKKLEDVNRIFKYVLIGLFMALLTSIMILDIYFCFIKMMYELAAISIVIWILLYYLIFLKIVKLIKKEIRL